MNLINYSHYIRVKKCLVQSTNQDKKIGKVMNGWDIFSLLGPDDGVYKPPYWEPFLMIGSSGTL